MTMIQPIAVERAWHLARLHGHHWASNGRPVAWAYARAIRAADAARAAWEPVLRDLRYGRDATEPEVVRLRTACETTIAIRDAAEDAWRNNREDVVEVVPRTEEEAVLIGMLPAGQCGGIYFRLAHRTQSGRLGWEITPGGVVTLTIYRPEDLAVLRATVHVGLGRRVTIEVLRPVDVEERHAATLTEAITAAAGVRLHPSVVMEEVYDLLPSRRTADVMAALAYRERVYPRMEAS